MSASFVVFIALLLTSIPLSFVSGWLLTRQRRVKAGHIREVMPSLPTTPSRRGSVERRWDRSMKRIERRLLAMFESSGARGVHTTQLAAQLGEPPELVEAVLARLREEIPCRMRILRSGTILHDFEAADIQSLQRARALSWPRQILMTTLAIFANIGAAWPFISVVIIVLMTFNTMSSLATEDAMINAGITGIGYSIGILLATVVSGWIAQLLFTTSLFGPKLGETVQQEKLPQRRVDNRYDDTFLPWIIFDTSASHRRNSYYDSSSSFSWGGGGSSSSSSSSSDSSFDLDDVEGDGVILVVVIIILVAILGAALTAIGVWLRGLWRAASRLNEPPLATSPTLWVRATQNIDKWEKYLPTNDLVIRALHALRRQSSFRRPPDDDLAARILILAKQKHNVLTGLDIAFHEGLDLNEAHEVGARLTGLLDGQILLDNEGELAFAFPDKALDKLVAKSDDDMWAEYVTFKKDSTAVRRKNQSQDNLPVNFVGLTKGHLQALSRLVAGTFLMAITTAYFILHLTTPLPWLVTAPILLVLFLMVLATTTLMTTSYATAKISAEHGVRRDIRRAVFKHIHRQIELGQPHTHMDDMPVQLRRLFAPAWSGLDEALIEEEIKGVVIDLELEPLVLPEHPDRIYYDLTTLRRRLLEDQAFSKVFDFEATTLDFGDDPQDDEVVFDTKIEHDQVTALGRA